MNIGDKYQVKIIDIDTFGNGIAKVNNIVIFIKGTFQNEIIEIKIIDIKKRYAIGRLINIIKHSIERKEIPCPHYYTCGGCNYLHISFDKENEYKENIIKNTFKDYQVNKIVHGKPQEYRNKVVFHVQNKEIGFYQKQTNTIVPVEKCLLLEEDIQNIYNQIKRIELNQVKEITIRTTTTHEVMIIFDGEITKENINYLQTNPLIKSIYIKDKLAYGTPYIKEKIENLIYTVNPNSFMQVNHEIMLKLYDKIKYYAKTGSNLLDLYCGTGTIGIYLKDNYTNITGVEIVKSAIENANLNKKLNHLNNINFILSDAKGVIATKSYDTIIVDPPRSGLTKDVINNLLNSNTQKIIYTSCNYKTLKQDLNLLEKKYQVIELTPFNMFPRTDNIECIALLEKNKKRY